MNPKVSIVWFRNDLRLHDNEAIFDASQASDMIIPVYIFDPRVFTAKTKFGFPKTGKFRAQFIIESINDLRASLQSKGSDLIVRIGKPEEELMTIVKETKASWIFCNRERTQEEVDVQDALEKSMWSFGRELRYSRGKMLYYTADLPFPVTHTPDTFTTFRKEVEKFVPVRLPFEVADDIFTDVEFIEDKGAIPSLSDFGHKAFTVEKGIAFIGGESEALRQLEYYFDEKKLASTYKKTRNELLGRDYSTKFSVWLSQGCLSPKMVYQYLKKYEEKFGANDSTYWIFFELLWRDFFRLMGKKHHNQIFKREGILGEDPGGGEDQSLFDLWANGKTGIPFIDANMKELNHTGFMSNRGRQNVASFLVKDLGLNWLMGAEYFESLLLDYDPCSNYGNWNYIAGVGCDPRDNRYFNILSQSKKYDPKGEYIKYWIPELENLPDNHIHAPDQMDESQLQQCDFNIQNDYVSSVVSSQRWV